MESEETVFKEKKTRSTETSAKSIPVVSLIAERRNSVKGTNDDGSPRRPRRRHEAHKSQNDHQTDVEITISCHGDDEPMINRDKLVSNGPFDDNFAKNETTDGFLCKF